MPTIGTLNEKPLHAALKERYRGPVTAWKSSSTAMSCRTSPHDDMWIEIQTSNVWHIKRKLAVLADHHPVRLVLPMALERWIVKVGPDGESLPGRRKSPLTAP